MTDYNFVFSSMRTEQVIAEIPLNGTYMDMELNVGGRLDGSFHLDMTGYDNQTLMDATIPGRTFVVCERNGIPIWCGYVWSRTYQSQAKSVQLYCQSFEYYPTHQLIRSSIHTGPIEQLVLFRDLWTHMQAVDGRNVNINLPSDTPPLLVSKAVEVDDTDFKFYDEVMSTLSDSSNGFDWTIDVAKSGIQYIKTLRYGYPALGSPDPTRLTFEYPGSLLNYYATESMVDAGTNVFTLGSGEGSSMLFEEVVHQDMIDGGSPRWDVIAPRKDIDDAAQLASFAEQEAIIRRPPMLVIKPTLKAEKIPEFGSFSLGDACSVTMTDARFPSTFTFQTRITKWTLQPQSSENTDEFSLFFAGDENE